MIDTVGNSSNLLIVCLTPPSVVLHAGAQAVMQYLSKTDPTNVLQYVVSIEIYLKHVIKVCSTTSKPSLNKKMGKYIDLKIPMAGRSKHNPL